MFITTESKITDFMPNSGVDLCHLLFPHTPWLSIFINVLKKKKKNLSVYYV